MSHGRVGMGAVTRRNVWGRVKAMIYIASAALFILAPGYGLAYERDPYLHNTLIGTISFQQLKYKTMSESNRSTSVNKDFIQVYSLTMRGKIFSRRLLIYDLGVRLDKVSGSAASNDRISRHKQTGTDYSFSTTALPLSAIPLTLSASHTKSNDVGYVNYGQLTRTYGLNWNVKMRGLPQMRLSLQQSSASGTRTNSLTRTYMFTARKKAGITDNNVALRKYTHVNNGTGENNSTASINYGNRTRFSRKTEMTATALKDTATSTVGGNDNAASVDMNLYSSPGDDFSQNHSYTYNSTKSKDKNELTLYAGDIDYSITDRLGAALSLSTVSNSITSMGSNLRNENVTSANRLRYMLTRRLAWVTSFTYSSAESNAPDSQINLRNHSRETVATGLSYRRQFKPFTLATSYKIGYTEEKVGTDRKAKGYQRKRGLTQGASLGLGRVRVWDYALVNASAQYTKTQNLAQDLINDTFLYHMSIMNAAGAGARYARAKASYTKRTTDAWNAKFNTRAESYGLSLKSTYFKRTKLMLNADKKSTTNGLTGTLRTEKMSAVMGHKRSSFLGETEFDAEADRSKTNDQANAKTVSIDRQKMKLKQTLSYFKATVFTLNVNRVGMNNGETKGERSRSVSAALRHSRVLFSGRLNANYSYMLNRTLYAAALERYSTRTLSLEYTKALFESVLWEGAFLRSRTKGEILYGTIPDVTEVKTALYYQFREWLFGTEISNRVSRTKHDRYTDKRVMFTISRQFVRVW
ncbi:MAG: hypothetical protein HY894_05415 [Deltaproteobacteria bacterium]|nr:hypothetical protein [Deltaproteobacteria bacterium]